MYKFIKSYTVNGYFEEPMYDEHPDIASYRKNITVNYKPGDVLFVDDIKEKTVRLADSPYGVSEHGSITRLRINIKELEYSGILYELSDDEIQKYWEIEKAKEEYDIAFYNMHHIQSYVNDEKNTLSEQILNEYVNAIIATIHAEADLVIASI